MMLIAAAPPLVLGWPTKRLPTTAMVMNLGIFGAVAAGPVFGGIQASSGGWRPLFWTVCGVGALAFLLSLLTFEDSPPQDPQAPRDWTAILLAGIGCAAAFFGASELQTHRMLDLIVFAPLLTGAGLLFALVVHQVTARNPLMPMRQLLHTFPASVSNPIQASVARWGPVFTEHQRGEDRATQLPATRVSTTRSAPARSARSSPLQQRRRSLPRPPRGNESRPDQRTVLTGVATGPDSPVIVGSGLVGLGASVAPALFTTGFSLRAGQLQRVFAMLELLRGSAAFAAGPIILHLATTTGGSPAAGIQIAVWVCFAIVATGAVISLYVFILGPRQASGT